MAKTAQADDLKLVGPRNKFPKVTLVEPLDSTFIVVALEVDRRPVFGYFWQSAHKKAAIALLKAAVEKLRGGRDIIDVTVFKAVLRPLVGGDYLRSRPELSTTGYDLVLLVELTNDAAAQQVRASTDWRAMEEESRKLSRQMLVLTATNARRIASVDHHRDGVFLFNYFYADTLAKNLAVWEYTAGWFQDQTGLDNSTLLVPGADQGSHYQVINHCRWDRMRDILPSLLFKRSFGQFVVANFGANRVVPIPMLYRLA